jgi:AcrR family transcriptional regulator
MPLERFYRLPDERRAHLLQVAAAEFAEKGFEAASLNAILAAAALSKGSYYYYFVDKEDLYAEALDSAFTRFQHEHEPLNLADFTAADFWSALDRQLRTWMRAAAASPELLRLFQGMDSARRRSPRFAPLLARIGELFGAAIERGRQLGRVRVDLPTATLIRLLLEVDAVLDDELFVDPREPTPQELERHTDLVLDMYRRIIESRPPVPRPTSQSRRRRP